MAKIEIDIIGADVCDMDGNNLGIVHSVQFDGDGVLVYVDPADPDDDGGETVEQPTKLRAVGGKNEKAA